MASGTETVELAWGDLVDDVILWGDLVDDVIMVSMGSGNTIWIPIPHQTTDVDTLETYSGNIIEDSNNEVLFIETGVFTTPQWTKI